MSSLMSNITNDFIAGGTKDINSFPQGFHIFDLSSEDFFIHLKKDISKILPDESIYHFPKMIPDVNGCKTHTSPQYLSDNVDFSTIYYLDDVLEKLPNLTKIIEQEDIYKSISSYYKNNFDSSFGVYHVSLYRNFKHNKKETGYLKWHSDNFPIYVKKVLVYLTDILCEDDGPTQIKYDDGTVKSVYGKAGTAIFFDMNFNHRGYQIQQSSKNKTRDMVYFSICPADVSNRHLVQSLGTDVIYPNDLNECFNQVDIKQISIQNKNIYESNLFSNKVYDSDDIRWLQNATQLKEKNIYIWGIGREALDISNKLKDDFKILGYIDWNIEESTEYSGLKVFAPDILEKDLNSYCIIASKRWRNNACYLENIKFTYKDNYIIKENNHSKDCQYPVVVGKRTYGEYNLINNKYFKLENFKGIVIGAFCSIGPNTKILETHIYDHRISTHPFIEFSDHGNYNNINPWKRYQELNGITKIGNDVWIGADVSIKPGITIGNGAIICANSVVTKDVPCYSIVVGVPASVIKYRYEQKEIDILNKVKWWNWADWELKENINLFLDEDKFFEYCLAKEEE